MTIAITMRIVARIVTMRIAAHAHRGPDITMRIVAQVTQGPLLINYDAHIKCTPKPRCVICTGFEDTTKMRAPS